MGEGEGPSLQQTQFGAAVDHLVGPRDQWSVGERVHHRRPEEAVPFAGNGENRRAMAHLDHVVAGTFACGAVDLGHGDAEVHHIAVGHLDVAALRGVEDHHAVHLRVVHGRQTHLKDVDLHKSPAAACQKTCPARMGRRAHEASWARAVLRGCLRTQVHDHRFPYHQFCLSASALSFVEFSVV
mmetsp:Transcript_7888/g.23272  ORF Transcript_7888/g.23272 Transcript_7888/m.23272 type:complete len:183 (-) Transcript_7888:1051-1599(-)